jgi:predicted SAM-dependent methyltransferase
MKLNLGCGADRRNGYVNVDLRSEVADYIADVSDLPFPDASVDEILASDILEHFPSSRISAIVEGWRRVLVDGGTLTVRVPNMKELGRLVAEDGPLTHLYIRNIYGGHRYGPDGIWDTHHTGWTPRMLHDLLTNAGFHVVANDEALNMTVEAKAI